MRSPFPGMDSYLELRWPGVHVALIAYIQEALQPQLPRDLRARAEERVVLESPDDAGSGRRRGDLAVVEWGQVSEPGAGAAHAVEPVFVEVLEEPEKERWVQIVEAGEGGRIVTVIEVLSPANKEAGRANDAYRKKIDEYVAAGVSIVEIDLLRSSRRRLGVGQRDLPESRRAPYLTCVRRATRPSRWEIYPMPLRERLPAVPVPLREGERDVWVDLQATVDRAYQVGGHDDLPYHEAPDPPFDAADAAWADALLRAAGRR